MPFRGGFNIACDALPLVRGSRLLSGFCEGGRYPSLTGLNRFRFSSEPLSVHPDAMHSCIKTGALTIPITLIIGIVGLTPGRPETLEYQRPRAGTAFVLYLYSYNFSDAPLHHAILYRTLHKPCILSPWGGGSNRNNCERMFVPRAPLSKNPPPLKAKTIHLPTH